MTRYLKLFVLITCLLALLACTRPEQSLVGNWSNTTTPETVEFRPDKSGVFQVPGMPSLNFRWKILDDGRAELAVDFQGEVKLLYAKLGSDSLTLQGGAQQATYRKSPVK